MAATPVLELSPPETIYVEPRQPRAQKAPTRVVMMTIPVEVPDVQIPFDLPYEDDENLESNWHRADISLLIQSYQQFRGAAKDYYAGGNMFIYFSDRQARNRDFRGPDFFVVLNVDGRRDRKYWLTWEEEGRYPDMIVELLSARTATVDRTTKKELYAKTFRTRNYFYYDPDKEELKGFHLVDGEYQDLQPNQHKWLWCEVLGLWVGTWRGVYQGHEHLWLRFYDENGNLVLTGEEAEKVHAAVEQQRAEEARQRAETEHRQAEEARQQAEAERRQTEEARQQAEAERQRAQEAQSALADLHTRLRAMGIDPDKI